MDNIFKQTKELCRIYEIKPQRKHGQNFLINEGIYQSIIKTAKLKSEDTVLEVGPGLGFLSALIAKEVKRLIAVEIDKKLVNILQIAINSQEVSNIEVVEKDILKFNPYEYLAEGEAYKVVANLPYNISSIFLRSFLSSSRPPESMTLMLQKELVERIIAKPPNMSLLSLSVQYYSKAKLIRYVPASDFWPSPVIDSAILHLEYRQEKEFLERDLADEKLFFQILRISFSSKRKALKNNLLSAIKIEKEDLSKTLKELGFNELTRAEELSLDDWKNLVLRLKVLINN